MISNYYCLTHSPSLLSFPTDFKYIRVMNLNKEEILFFVSSVIFLILSVFTEYLNDLIIVVLVIMLVWMNRIIRKRNKS